MFNLFMFTKEVNAQCSLYSGYFLEVNTGLAFSEHKILGTISLFHFETSISFNDNFPRNLKCLILRKVFPIVNL